MTLNELVHLYIDELRDGIAWVVFWKTINIWNAVDIWLDIVDGNFVIKDDDKVLIEEVLHQDSNAVILNSYYCDYLNEDMSVEELTNGVRWHYDNKSNLLKDFLDKANNGELLRNRR